MSYHVDLISSLEALDGLRDPWLALHAAVPANTGFFSSYHYLRIYLEFHRPPGWTVVAVYDGKPGELLAVFPLQLFNLQDGATTYRACKPLGVAYASFVGFPVRSDRRHEVLSVLLNDILRDHFHCDLAFLGPLFDASPLAFALLESLDAQSLKLVRIPNTLSQIDTRGLSFEDYFRHRKSLTLPNARYQARRLSKLGNVAINLADQGDDLAAGVVQLCQRNEAHFPGANNYRQHPNWHAYMAQLAVQLAPLGIAEFATLRLDGQIIASSLSFVNLGRRYFYLTAYDPTYARYSPSKILMARLIEHTFAEQGVFCFGPGLYPYKLDWAQSIGDLRTPIVFFNPQCRQALDERLVAGKLSTVLA